MTNIELAHEIAKRCHAGQLYAGEDYYQTHILGVLDILVNELGVMSEEAIITAILHDVCEDSDFDLESIPCLFGDKIRDNLFFLTNNYECPASYYDHYINDIIEYGDDTTRLVKISDAIFNYRSCIAEGGKWLSKAVKYKGVLLKLAKGHELILLGVVK